MLIEVYITSFYFLSTFFVKYVIHSYKMIGNSVDNISLMLSFDITNCFTFLMMKSRHAVEIGDIEGLKGTDLA